MRTRTMRTKTMRTKAGKLVLTVLCSAFLALPALADNTAGLTPGEGDKEKIDKALGKGYYSPYANRKYPTRPLFGDTHLHTWLSS